MMFKKILGLVPFAGAIALVGSTAATAAVQTLSFSGTLQNGYNNAGGPFGPSNTDLTGKAYSVTLSYDPSQFVTSNSSINSCGLSPGVSCSFTFSSTRTLTEQIVVNGITQNFVGTTGTLTLLGTNSQNFSFNFSGAAGLSLSGFFQDGSSLFPNPNNVNNPIFSNFTNLALTGGTFNQSSNTYSLGANPTRLSASYVASVPEPAAWTMMIVGFGAAGLALRRRERRGTTSLA